MTEICALEDETFVCGGVFCRGQEGCCLPRRKWPEWRRRGPHQPADVWSAAAAVAAAAYGVATNGHRMQDNGMLRAMEIRYCYQLRICDSSVSNWSNWLNTIEKIKNGELQNNGQKLIKLIKMNNFNWAGN